MDIRSQIFPLSHGIPHLHYKTQSGFLRKEKKVVLLLLEGLTTVVTVSSTEALCWSSFEQIAVSCFSGRRNSPSAQGPCHILRPLCVLYRASCLNPPPWGRAALTVCSGTSRRNDQFIPDDLVVQKNNKKKNSFEVPTLPLCKAFHSNSCWYLLFLWW